MASMLEASRILRSIEDAASSSNQEDNDEHRGQDNKGGTTTKMVKTKKARQKNRSSRTNNADFSCRPTMNERTVSKSEKQPRNKHNCIKDHKTRDKNKRRK